MKYGSGTPFVQASPNRLPVLRRPSALSLPPNRSTPSPLPRSGHGRRPGGRRTSRRRLRRAPPSSWQLPSQPSRQRGMALGLGDVERGLAVVVAGGGVGAVRQEQLGEREVAAERRLVQRRVAAGRPRIDVGAAGQQPADDAR